MNNTRAHHNHFAEVRRTLQLAAPVMLGQVAVFSMSFVDTVMAGRLPEREIALAGLGIGTAVWSGLMMFTIGLLMAVQPSVAHLDGAGRRQEAAVVTRQAFWIALCIAVPYWAICFFSRGFLEFVGIDPLIVPVAAGFLRAISWGGPGICFVFLLRYFCEGAGHTRATMVYGVVGAVLNVPLNYIFIYGKLGFPALGAVGCGYATATVIWVQLFMLVAYVGAGRHFKPFHLFSHFERPRWKDISELLHLGLPIAVSISLEGGLFVTAALLIGQLGPLSSAAHLIAINFSAMVYMIPLGLASAITIRVGNALGRGDPASARYAGIVGFLIVVCLQCCSMSIMFFLPGAVVSLYTNDVAVSALAVSLLFYAGIFQLPDGIQVAAAGGLRGLKDTRMPMLYNFIAYWVIGATLGYYLTFKAGMGPSGMWIGMIAGLTIGATLLTIRFLRKTARMLPASSPSPATVC